MNWLGDELWEEFQDREYRQAYSEDHLNVSVASQIKVLREQRGWTQERLARNMGTKQSVVSRIEDVNYESWSIKTLKRLARAFDVHLAIKFESWAELISEIESFGRGVLLKDPFDEEVKRRTEVRQIIWPQLPGPGFRTVFRVTEGAVFKVGAQVDLAHFGPWSEDTAGPFQPSGSTLSEVDWHVDTGTAELTH